MIDLNDFSAQKGPDYLQQLLADTDSTLQSIDNKILSIKTTENNLQTLTEHPRINAILRIEDTFALPGQVVTSGEVFLTIGDYKISLTPQQAIKHLGNQLKLAKESREVCMRQKGNIERRIKVADEGFGRKQVGGDVGIDDRTVGRVFECGEFYEIVEFQRDDLESKFDGLKMVEKRKRVARVNNEAEKQMWFMKHESNLSLSNK